MERNLDKKFNLVIDSANSSQSSAVPSSKYWNISFGEERGHCNEIHLTLLFGWINQAFL